MDAPVGTLIAFATAPGSVASDGDGQNGLYTQHLLQSLQKPGAKIEDVFKNVRAAVRKDSGGKQIPWESTSLEGDFIFITQPPAPAAVVSAATSATSLGKIDSIPAPQLNTGDSWTYQSIDMLSGSVMEKFTRRITNTTADELRFGGYITDKSLNLLRRVRDGKVTTQWTPKRPFYDFPLNVGKTWSSVGVLDTDDRNVNVAFTYKGHL